MIIDGDPSFKFLDPKRLSELLLELPPNTVVAVNRVGNIAVCTREGDEFQYAGYIDFLFDGSVEV